MSTLLGLLQTGFPVSERPFADLGERLHLSEDDVLKQVRQLKETGVIRTIGPVVNPRALGYQTTLVGMRVEKGGLRRAEKVIAGHSGVSHGYEREHRFNVWFTIAVPAPSDIEAEAMRLASDAGAESAFSAPAVRVFKIGAYFGLDGGHGHPGAHRGHAGHGARLSKDDRDILNALQQELPLVPSPFSLIADSAGMSVDHLIEAIPSLEQRGVLRRFGASVNHRKVGYAANAMSCWSAPPEKVDFAGQRLASLPEVSHCYERRTCADWRFNLFAMIHAHSRAACREIARIVSRETGLTDCLLLYSTREFKKTRIRYLA